MGRKIVLFLTMLAVLLVLGCTQGPRQSNNPENQYEYKHEAKAIGESSIAPDKTDGQMVCVKVGTKFYKCSGAVSRISSSQLSPRPNEELIPYCGNLAAQVLHPDEGEQLISSMPEACRYYLAPIVDEGFIESPYSFSNGNWIYADVINGVTIDDLTGIAPDYKTRIEVMAEAVGNRNLRASHGIILSDETFSVRYASTTYGKVGDTHTTKVDKYCLLLNPDLTKYIQLEPGQEQNGYRIIEIPDWTEGRYALVVARSERDSLFDNSYNGSSSADLLIIERRKSTEPTS